MLDSKPGRIYDAVYGYIELDEIEFALVKSPLFQRLHWIKQLGPLNTIFPSAQHSRFSHSIGVLHITKKMINHLTGENGTYKNRVTEDEKTALKIAALLHDIGHVPMSHVGEIVLKNTYQPKVASKDIEAFAKDKPASWKAEFPDAYRGGSTKLHECLSAEIVLNSKEIDDILHDSRRWHEKSLQNMKNDIAQIIGGKFRDQVLGALLHSELDADRLDYLLRDSFFTGVGYGHVDLDYIISRLTVGEDNKAERLCIENKGLHTVEHYILGRFFLQTQVIFNRKVKLMDLLFNDVMEHFVSARGKSWHVMDLSEILEHVRYRNSTGIRTHLHRIYEYTDAAIFVGMRQFHDDIDEKLRNKKASSESLSEGEKQEEYINECVKLIMDGKIPDPEISHQKLFSVASLADEEHIRSLRKKAKEIAHGIAAEFGIHPQRIKADISGQEVMKYTDRPENEEANSEAVHIKYDKSDDSYDVEPAAKSNATILKDLIDKSLVVFNVFFLPSKSKQFEQLDDDIRKKIKEEYHGFIEEHFNRKTMSCGCRDGLHLCQIVGKNNWLADNKELLINPQFICKKCGRMAASQESLCLPVQISD